MRSDQTAAEFAQPQTQSVLAPPLGVVDDIAPQKSARTLARVTFCFAWLFGLEPFLTGLADDSQGSASRRNH